MTTTASGTGVPGNSSSNAALKNEPALASSEAGSEAGGGACASSTGRIDGTAERPYTAKTDIALLEYVRQLESRKQHFAIVQRIIVMPLIPVGM